MVNWKSKKLGDVLVFANCLVVIVLLNLLLSSYFFRIDLTEEKRYSIKPQTRELLQQLEDDVYIEVFLEGDLNAEFKRFQKAIRETLEEFEVYSNNRVKFSFTDPAAAAGQKAQAEFMNDLNARGIQPTNVISNNQGQRVEKIIFPGLIVSYDGMESGVMLLKGNKAGSPAEEINQSIEGIEFEVARAISKLAKDDRKQIAFIQGHGELDSLSTLSVFQDIREEYDVVNTRLTNASLRNFDALVLAKPTRRFSPQDRYFLDQYIMSGKPVLFLIDKLDASMDSASRDDYFALPYNTELDEMLFKYGVRINLDLVQDRMAGFYPIVTGQRGGKPQMSLLDWPFFPLINHYPEHPITRNLDAVLTRFVSSMDTVKAPGIRKTPLMLTSQLSRVIGAPVKVSVNDLRNPVPDEQYTKPSIPLGYLLEGSFTSLFKNRFLPDGISKDGFKEDGTPAKLIVIADGDLVRNDFNPRTNQAQPLGFDMASNYTFANRELVLNILGYLTSEEGLIQVRNKQVKIRPLDKTLIQDKLKWQVINLVLPVVMLIAFGAARMYWRKRKYARF
ncbi:gliding motility-associated ABC transporter substrate-binding protein GldG [Chryseolinea sp. T2]|uniref:gliding motility-associated ABC transporter substrate-binding protein GldG n=1 Tax=Chryseolinea sp. T2 TaxID=3129255 RepID=UPI003076EF46